MRALVPLLVLLRATALAAEPRAEEAIPAEPRAADTAPAPRPASTPAVATPSVVEKLDHGDRLMLAGDHRNALFAYQDAVYLQPSYAPARVRLGRAYLALRYPAFAIAQAEAALAEDPDSADARTLLEEASSQAARAQAVVPGAVAPGAVAPGVVVQPPRAVTLPAPRSAPRVFRLPSDSGDAPPRTDPASVPTIGGR